MQLKGFKKPYWRFENGRRLRGEGGGGIGGLIARKGTINKSLYKKQCLAVYYSTQLCSCIQVSSIRGGIGYQVADIGPVGCVKFWQGCNLVHGY